MGSALDLAGELSRGERRDARGLARIDHHHQARASSGQRHQSEGPARRMEFRRAVLVRALVAEIEGEGGLRVAPPIGRDAGGAPAQGTVSVGADRQPGAERCAVPQLHRDAGRRDRDRARVVRDEGEGGKRARAGVERGDEEPVLDIVAEGIEPDLAGGKMHLRGAQQAGGIVDDAHDPQRRGGVAAVLPDAERVEGGDGARQQRGGAVVRRAGRPRHQRGFDARARQRDRRGEAHGPAADDHHLDRSVAHAVSFRFVPPPGRGLCVRCGRISLSLTRPRRQIEYIVWPAHRG